MIETYLPKRIVQLEAVEGAYTFNPRRRLHWLQKICLFVLERLGCQQYRTEEDIQMVRIDLRDIARTLVKSKHAMMDVYRMRAKYVVLGQRQMMDLRVEELGPAIINMPGDFGKKFKPSFDHQLNLITIPWLDDGILALPDLDQMPAVRTSW